MKLLEGVEFGEEGIEAAEEFERSGRVQVVDGRDGEAEEEEVGGFAGEFTRIVGWHAGEVVFVEEIRVEPIDTTFVTTTC